MSDLQMMIENLVTNAEAVADLLGELGAAVDHDPPAVRQLRKELGYAMGELIQGLGPVFSEVKQLEERIRS